MELISNGEYRANDVMACYYAPAALSVNDAPKRTVLENCRLCSSLVVSVKYNKETMLNQFNVKMRI